MVGWDRPEDFDQYPRWEIATKRCQLLLCHSIHPGSQNLNSWSYSRRRDCETTTLKPVSHGLKIKSVLIQLSSGRSLYCKSNVGRKRLVIRRRAWPEGKLHQVKFRHLCVKTWTSSLWDIRAKPPRQYSKHSVEAQKSIPRTLQSKFKPISCKLVDR